MPTVNGLKWFWRKYRMVSTKSVHATLCGIISFWISCIGTSVPATPRRFAILVCATETNRNKVTLRLIHMLIDSDRFQHASHLYNCRWRPTRCNYFGLFIYSWSALHASGDVFAVPSHPWYQLAAISVVNTRSCKYSRVLPTMGEDIARNMQSRLGINK